MSKVYNRCYNLIPFQQWLKSMKNMEPVADVAGNKEVRAILSSKEMNFSDCDWNDRLFHLQNLRIATLFDSFVDSSDAFMFFC